MNKENNTQTTATDVHDQMRRAVAAFLDGSSDAALERRLYDYFASGPVAHDLEPYADMFAWYAAGVPGLEGGQAARPAATVRRHRRRDFSRRLFTGIAATLAVALASWGVVAVLRTPSPTDAELFSGSYMMSNGRRITDIEAIMPRLLDAERIADAAIAAHTAMLSDIDSHMAACQGHITDGITNPEAIELLTDEF